jgi:AraC-like DNA-binding protein
MEFIYQEYQPSGGLRAIVDCYWSVRTTGSRHELSPKHRCLPLGMVELIIHQDDNLAHGVVGNQLRIFPKAMLAGIMKEPMCWQMRGDSTAFGVRLKPEGVIGLFRTPLADLCNDFVDAETFLGKDRTPILQNVREAADDPARIALMEDFLQGQLARVSPEKNYFTQALGQIRNKEGGFTHSNLEKKLQVGERQLQRMFKDNLGMSPKSYFRLMRFRQAVASVRGRRQVDWLDLTHALGYTDQSHLIRDFKEFAGVPPSALCA